MRTRIAALIATLLAAPILAAVPASAAGLDGMGQAIFGNSFNFIKANIEKPPVKAIGVGKLTVQLQRTKLKDIQKAFGGTIRREGDEASRADWLCYSAEGANVWFISNALGRYEFVMMAAAETASKPSKNCDAAPRISASRASAARPRTSRPPSAPPPATRSPTARIARAAIPTSRNISAT